MKAMFKEFTVRLLSLAINVQLLVSPMAFATETNDGLTIVDPNTTTESKDSNKKTGSFWNQAQKYLGMGMNAVNQGMQMINKDQQAQPMASLLAKPIDPRQLPPALQQADCFVFEARTNSPSDSMCNPQSANPQEAGQALSLLATAESNINEFENYLVNANESSTSQGKACLNKAMIDLQKTLNARMERLNQFEKLVEDTIKHSIKQNEDLLNSLKKGDALLNGRSKDKEKNSLADFDFGKQFQSPECASFMKQSDIGKSGDKGGFREIAKMLADNFESGDQKSADAYTPKELYGNEQMITKDIDDMLANFNQNIQDTDSVELKSSQLIDGSQSESFPVENKTISNILKTELKKYEKVFRDKKKMFKGIPKETLALIENGNESSSDAAAVYKRTQYNQCLSGYVGNTKKFAKSITNHTLSSGANRNRDSLLRTKVHENLKDDEIGIDQKIANIVRYDTNASEKISISSSQTLCGTTIYADTRIGVSKLMSLYKCECERQYTSKSSGQSMSAKDVEQQLAGYSNYIRNKKSLLSQNIAREVKNRVVNCPSNNTTGVGSLSCSKALNKSSKNFCLRTAKICAGNMDKCSRQATEILVQTRVQQKTWADRYKIKMNDLKAKLQLAFMNNGKMEETISRNFEHLYKVGTVYNVPKDLKMDQLQNKLIKGLDPSLAVEDPEQYLKIMKEDIEKTRMALKKSNNDIFGADVENFKGLASAGASTSGFLGRISGYLENAEKEKARWTKIKANCNSTIAAMKQQIQNMNKEDGENYKKQQETLAEQTTYCKNLIAFSNNGCDGVSSSFGDFAANIGKATDSLTGNSSANKIQDYCNDEDSRIEKLTEKRSINQKFKLVESFCNDNKENKELNTLCEQNIEKVCKHDLYELSQATNQDKEYCFDEDSEKVVKMEKCENNIDFAKINAAPTLIYSEETEMCMRDLSKEGDSLDTILEKTSKEECPIKNKELSIKTLADLRDHFSTAKEKFNALSDNKLISDVKGNCKFPDQSPLSEYAYPYAANKSARDIGEDAKKQCKSLVAGSRGNDKTNPQGDKSTFGKIAEGLQSIFK